MMLFCLSELYIDFIGRFTQHTPAFDAQVDGGKIITTSKVSKNGMFLT